MAGRLFWPSALILLIPIWAGAHFPSDDGVSHICWTQVYHVTVDVALHRGAMLSAGWHPAFPQYWVRSRGREAEPDLVIELVNHTGEASGVPVGRRLQLRLHEPVTGQP